MIFWFSGTGNSHYVAQQLAEQLNDRLIAVSDALLSQNYDYALQQGESIGFVFPTYSWGPAPVVLDFIRNMKVAGVTSATYCYMVTTCGDDVGLSVPIFDKTLRKQGLTLQGAFSVQMPNNYICMKGFDVDPDQVRQQKLRAAPERIAHVAMRIAEHRCTTDVVTGRWRWVKSRIIRPWFKRYAMSDKPFHADSAACIGCGKCVETCPMRNIELHDGLPEWHGRCAMCLACVHHCPVRAIQYGKQTQDKGRYYFKKTN